MLCTGRITETNRCVFKASSQSFGTYELFFFSLVVTLWRNLGGGGVKFHVWIGNAIERSLCLSAGVWVCREPYCEHHPCQGLHGQGVHFGNQALAASQGGDEPYLCSTSKLATKSHVSQRRLPSCCGSDCGLMIKFELFISLSHTLPVP